MDLYTAINTRRSVRSYTDETVSEEDIRILLEAAMAAPSAGNAQPWHFVVIDDKSLLEQVPAINPYASMAPKAPLGILVCADKTAEKFPGFWPQDCAAAVQNMLLAVVERGLGAVWTGIYPSEERCENFAKLFELPHYVVAMGLIVIGHPKEEQKPLDRFSTQKIHRNRW